MFDLTVLGELLIDFTQNGVSPAGMRVFERNPGGSVANAATAAARLGAKAAFIGKVGTDMHGAFLRRTLIDAGVDVRGLVMTDDVFTTLAFVELEPSGEREFSFARKPGADTCITVDELDTDLLGDTKVFDIGSLSLTDEPARGTTLHAVKTAKAAGAVIAYDPNYRASLWRSRDEAVEQMRSPLPYVDMIKLSDEEAELITGKSDPKAAISCLNERGIEVAAVTLGADGAMVGLRGQTRLLPPFVCKAVDATGAGDAFWGGFLYRFIKSGKSIAALTPDDAAGFGEFANAVAALCVQHRGGIPAMPDIASVQALLATRK